MVQYVKCTVLVQSAKDHAASLLPARRRDSRGPEWAAPQNTPAMRTACMRADQRSGSDWSKRLQRDPSDRPRQSASEYRHLVTLVYAGWSKHGMGGEGPLVTLGKALPGRNGLKIGWPVIEAGSVRTGNGGRYAQRMLLVPSG